MFQFIWECTGGGWGLIDATNVESCHACKVHGCERVMDGSWGSVMNGGRGVVMNEGS